MAKPDSNIRENQGRAFERQLQRLSEGGKLTITREAFLDGVNCQIASMETDQSSEKTVAPLIRSLDKYAGRLESNVHFQDVGTVQHIGNGVATVSGLPNVSIDEIVTFPTGVRGLALNLEKKHVDLILLGPDEGIRGGDLAQATGKRLKVPVGKQLLGRILDPLGNPLDSNDPIIATEYRSFSEIAPGVIKRAPVNQALSTGTKTIDALFPIGRGQRELIIGDRQTGKTTLAIDAILNQKETNVHCIYVAIGQKKSSTLSVINTLSDHDMLERSIIVISSPDDPPALRYLAPFTGATIGEYFLDQGEDVLIVYDDLTNHANAYRELSLLLRRPPGREAYPGDIFYLHASLLERACKLDEDYGGGSITALPIATTQNGNVAAYIPTNLISITDGQLVLDADLFHKGQKPAIDIGRSVSRVGSAAQSPAMRMLVGDLKLELSQYEEVAHFARFGTDVNEATQRQIEKGDRIINALTQKPHQPLTAPFMIIFLYTLVNGFLNACPLNHISKYEMDLRTYLQQRETKLLDDIKQQPELTDTIKKEITATLKSFNQMWFEERGETL
jgi:F-type H+/Na+-transporting ATPase subunit alpha